MFLSVLALFAIGFIIHFLVWRIRVPKKQTKTIIIIFSLNLFWLLFLDLTFEQMLHVTVAYISLVLAYIATYPAIEVDSPSLVIICKIASEQPVSDLSSMESNEVLVLPRIRDLVEDKLAKINDDRLVLTKSGKAFIRTILIFRRTIGAGKGG